MLSPTYIGKRWPRGQKFRLSLKGREADTTYVECIKNARALSGRPALDSARRIWAETLSIQPGDGLYLAELREEKTVQRIAAALEDCGATLDEVRQAVDRMVEAGIVEAVNTGNDELHRATSSSSSIL